MNSLGKWWTEITTQLLSDIKTILRNLIYSNLKQGFANFNSYLDKFTESLSKSPEAFNPSAYQTVTELAKNAILPVGVIILAFVFVMELYEFIKDTNSGVGTFNQGKYFELVATTAIMLIIITHATDIVQTVFLIGAEAVEKASATATVPMPDFLYTTFIATEEDLGALIGALVTSFIIKLSMYVINIALILCMYARMFEIYLYISAAPAPLATLQSKDWGEVGKNYIRALIALALQAFFMLAIIAIYGAVLGGMNTAGGDLDSVLLECLAFCVLAVLMLWKAGGISKAIFNAH